MKGKYTMKRCGVFVFFNEQGIVEAYVEMLLKSMEEVLDKLFIIINGKITNDEKIKLYKYTNSIYQRDNVGFDGGAYKDFFLKVMNIKELCNWDEILLINDTFYGPFFPWSEIFELMNESICDFWGLTSHPGGIELFLGEKLVSPHVQSYFILIKKRMFSHQMFHKFWQNLKYPTNYKEAVQCFEIYFTEYFTQLGFRYESWLEVKKRHLGFEPLDYIGIDTQILRLHFPVLKRKMYLLQCYINLKKVFQYLERNTSYPLEMIQQDVYKRCIQGKVKPYNPEEIKEFCSNFKEVYLFGMGIYAKNIEFFLSDIGVKISGNIISEKKEKLNGVFELDEFKIKSWQGVVVALNQKNLNEVEGALLKKFSRNQIYLPIYE